MVTDTPGNNLYEWLKIIRTRYWQYVGSQELPALKGCIHGYLQGLFHNKVAEQSFPKYRWFSTWVKGRIESELDLGYGWDDYIISASLNEDEAETFFTLYDEFIQSEIKCWHQSITNPKKMFREKPHGYSWETLNDQTNELLLFQLPPSTSCWCLMLDESKNILHTTDAESKEILLEKIKTNYFAVVDSEWISFDGKFFLKNLILGREENNY
ncbi:MAG: hypothetical protein KF803_00565 [Cyclobacteriaceae bacterium]|nr:hypothetical protein [Cyclobacteriaceae bacterium]